MKPKRITDGWYIFDGYALNRMTCANRRQIIEVIEGCVYITGVSTQFALKEAKKSGTFIERIDLYKGKTT